MSMTAPAKTKAQRLDEVAAHIRMQVIEMSHRAKTPHLGSSLSCVDLIVALYGSILNIDSAQPDAPERDRFVLSKGHAATTLYAVLAEHGFFPKAEIEQYAEPGSPLPEHPAPKCIAGIEAATGSLGHGLSLGVGMALSASIQKLDYRTYVLLSDGECNEGSTWEAAMMAPAHGLSNLFAIVDFNKWQATGRSQEVMSIEPLEEKFAAFGWNAKRIDGHDMSQILDALIPSPATDGKPTAIIADTVKGKGVSFMEDDNNWHYRIPNEEEVELARDELLGAVLES